jgi:hypothetical protein
MQRLPFILLFSMVPLALFGQGTPRWLNEQNRTFDFPRHTYITGFAMIETQSNEPLDKTIGRVKTEAQGALSKTIRVKIEETSQSSTKSISGNNPKQYFESEEFSKESVTSSNAEVVGVKVETYHDKANGTIYAFAYANKYELAGYYKANIAMLVKQVEGALKTAEQLEQSGEKAKARKQCEEVIPTLAQVRYAQDLLTAIDAADSESLQQAQSEALRNTAAQMLARLAQGLVVYINSAEDIFGKSSNIIANKLKSMLAANGCSFIDDPEQADLKLTLSATTRKIGKEDATVKFCYADVVVELYSNFRQKVMFNDEFAQKGGATSYDTAGRKAMEGAVAKIAEKVMPWIKN